MFEYIESLSITDKNLKKVKRMLFEKIMLYPFEIAKGTEKTLVYLFPEIFLSMKVSFIWTNFEERRTVFGPDIDEISEVDIRKAAGLPLRYIYQESMDYFAESINILPNNLSKYVEQNNRISTIRNNMFPTSTWLMPLPILFKLHGFKLQEVLQECGSLQHIAMIFGYKKGDDFLQLFDE